MLPSAMIGALLFVCGVVYLAAAAIYRGRMSDPRPNIGDTADHTLEPRHRGVGFLGLKANWPGFLLIVAGIVMLFLPFGQ